MSRLLIWLTQPSLILQRVKQEHPATNQQCSNTCCTLRLETINKSVNTTSTHGNQIQKDAQLLELGLSKPWRSELKASTVIHKRTLISCYDSRPFQSAEYSRASVTRMPELFICTEKITKCRTCRVCLVSCKSAGQPHALRCDVINESEHVCNCVCMNVCM